MEVTEKEKELIEAVRNLRNSKHNYSWELELWVRELFEKLLESDESRLAQLRAILTKQITQWKRLLMQNVQPNSN